MKYLTALLLLLTPAMYAEDTICHHLTTQSLQEMLCEDDEHADKERGEWEPEDEEHNDHHNEDRHEREFERADPAEVEKFVRKHMPIATKKLDAMGARGLKIMQRECRDMYHHYREIAAHEPNEAKKQAKMFDLEMATHLTGDFIRNTRERGQDTKEAEAELGTYLEQLFALKHQQMEREAKHLRRELLEIEEVLKERTANKAAIIKRQSAILSGKRDPLEF